MTLARMIATDEDALECDLAETYHIYDYRELPLTRVALFASGLSENSRIKRKMSGAKLSIDTYLLVMIADYLGWIAWSKTKDAAKNRNKPQTILSLINGKGQDKKESENRTFDTGEDFEKLREKLLEKAKKGG